jgi:hypothetical protein
MPQKRRDSLKLSTISVMFPTFSPQAMLCVDNATFKPEYLLVGCGEGNLTILDIGKEYIL